MNRRKFITNAAIASGAMSTSLLYDTLSDKQTKLLDRLQKNFSPIQVSELPQTFQNSISRRSISIQDGIRLSNYFYLFPVLKEDGAFLLVDDDSGIYEKISYKQVKAYNKFTENFFSVIEQNDAHQVVLAQSMVVPTKLLEFKKGLNNLWSFNNTLGNTIIVSSIFGKESLVSVV